FGERQVADLLEHLDDGQLRPSEVGAARQLLREATTLRVEVDRGLEDLIHIALEFRADGGSGHYFACEISAHRRPPSTGAHPATMERRVSPGPVPRSRALWAPQGDA